MELPLDIPKQPKVYVPVFPLFSATIWTLNEIYPYFELPESEPGPKFEAADPFWSPLKHSKIVKQFLSLQKLSAKKLKSMLAKIFRNEHEKQGT